MYLTLPLPDNRVRTFQATVVHVDGSAGPMKFCVQVPWAGEQWLPGSRTKSGEWIQGSERRVAQVEGEWWLL